MTNLKCERGPMYTVRFKGKRYPKDFPSKLSFVAPDKERAKEWVHKQLQTWGLPLDISFDLSEGGAK